MTYFVQAVGTIVLFFMTVTVPIILIYVGIDRYEKRQRRKRSKYSKENLTVGDYVRVRSTEYECVALEYYRGKVYAQCKPLKESNHQIDATGRFDDDLLTDDRRLVSIFDFGDITEILGHPTIK